VVLSNKTVYAKMLIGLAALFLLIPFIPKIFSADSDTGSGITVGPPVAEYTIVRGQTANGIVKVNDYSPTPITLYPQVSDFGAKDESGQPAFFESDPNRKFSLSSWIKFSPEPVNLAVGELRAIPYQITVPPDAEPGGHYGVIFFSTKAPDDVKEGEAKVGANLKVGQLLLVTVPGAVEESASVATFKTSFFNMMPKISFKKDNKWGFYWDWKINFVTRIQNDGNVHIKPAGKIEIKDIVGQKTVSLTVNEAKGNVLPESTRLFENGLKMKWWQMGYFKANLDLTYGQSQSLHDSLGFLVIPWWLIATVIIVGFIIWWRVRKRKKKAKI
jgi:hypothetical protein